MLMNYSINILTHELLYFHYSKHYLHFTNLMICIFFLMINVDFIGGL